MVVDPPTIAPLTRIVSHVIVLPCGHTQTIFLLRGITKRYEFRTGEARARLGSLATEVFPSLLSLLRTLTAQHSLDAALQIVGITKTYYSTVHFDFSGPLAAPEVRRGTLLRGVSVVPGLFVRPAIAGSFASVVVSLCRSALALGRSCSCRSLGSVCRRHQR